MWRFTLKAEGVEFRALGLGCRSYGSGIGFRVQVFQV